MKTLNVRGLRLLALAGAGLLALSACSGGSGSKAPPQGTKGGKMPGVPKAEPVTTAAIAGAVQSYVTANAAGGTWNLTDPTTGQPVTLTWTKTHDEMLMPTGPDAYVACAEFTAPDGVVYDVDFSVTGANADNLSITGSEIHSVGGVARYTWAESGGTYTKQAPAAPLPG